jgi:hypothetical protein
MKTSLTSSDRSFQDRELHDELAITGKYRSIARERSVRARAYAAAVAFGALA